jgi:hypothetical protein
MISVASFQSCFVLINLAAVGPLQPRSITADFQVVNLPSSLRRAQFVGARLGERSLVAIFRRNCEVAVWARLINSLDGQR